MNCQFVPLSEYNWTLSDFDILPWNPTVYCLVAGFFAVNFWLTLELTGQVLYTFKKYRGIYFYSILIAIWGVALHTLGLLLKLFVPQSPPELGTILAKVGWVADTTGFAVVLYSRLHLVVRNPRMLQIILAFIIFDAFLFHTPIIVLLMGMSTNKHNNWAGFVLPFERIQVLGFTLQETFISGIYIWTTARFLKGGYSYQLRRVMISLILAQLAVVMIDIQMITIDWINLFTLKAIMHPFTYAVKLKIEFVVLNLLLDLVKYGPTTGRHSAPDDEISETRFPIRSKSKSVSIFSELIAPPQVPRYATTATTTPTVNKYNNDDNNKNVSIPQQGITKMEEIAISWQDRTRINSVPESAATIVSKQQKPRSTPPPSSTLAAAAELKRLDTNNTSDSSSSDTLGENEPQTIDEIERQYLGRYGLYKV